jgi:Rps23 Pro-64 3,4-dihydroxylase Tpa1-like proline 4-hydroxylase
MTDRTTERDAPRAAGLMPPHTLVRDLLAAEDAEQLVDWAIGYEALFKPTRVGNGEAGRRDETLRRSAGVRDFGPLGQTLRERVVGLAPTLVESLRMSRFSVDHLELELVAHNDGAFYGRHMDITDAGRHGEGGPRVLSSVFYVFRRPKAFSGGAFRLHAFNGDGFQDIEPEHNLLLAFPAWASHEVRPVTCPSGQFADSRFAVNIWLCTREA